MLLSSAHVFCLDAGERSECMTNQLAPSFAVCLLIGRRWVAGLPPHPSCQTGFEFDFWGFYAVFLTFFPDMKNPALQRWAPFHLSALQADDMNSNTEFSEPVRVLSSSVSRNPDASVSPVSGSPLD